MGAVEFFLRPLRRCPRLAAIFGANLGSTVPDHRHDTKTETILDPRQPCFARVGTDAPSVRRLGSGRCMLSRYRSARACPSQSRLCDSLGSRCDRCSKDSLSHYRSMHPHLRTAEATSCSVRPAVQCQWFGRRTTVAPCPIRCTARPPAVHCSTEK